LLPVALIMVACQAGPGLSGREREEYLKAIKPYGKLWKQEGVSEAQWLDDWISCGGMKNGGYSIDVPSGSKTEIIFAASRNKRDQLSSCMRQLGYTFHPDVVFREP
jgi:hypothetical protein